MRLVAIRWSLRRRGGRPLVGIWLIEHFGDIVACEPIVREIRAQTPNAYIVWGVRRAYRELIDSNPLIDETMVLHCLGERVWLGDTRVFDRVVDLHLSGRYCTLCPRPVPAGRASCSITLENFYRFGGILSAFAQSAGLPALDEQPRVYIDAEVQKAVDALHLPERYIVVHGKSNAAAKDWSEEKWRELFQRVVRLGGMHVIEVGLDPVLRAAGENRVYRDLCGRLSLLQTAEVIHRARLFVGIDSGPAHFANALGTYGIVLLGSYIGFEKYNPFSKPFRGGINCDLLHAPGVVADIPVDSVYQSIERAWGRAAPGLHT